MIMSFVQALDNSVNSAVSVLTEDLFTGAMYNLANTIREDIRPIAITILSLCFVIEFLNILIHQDLLKWETGFKVGAKLVLTYVALDISSQLMEAIYATGSNLIGDVVSAVGTVNSDMGALISDNLRAAMSGLGIIKMIGLLATVGFGFLIIWLAGVVIMVMAYGRSIELLLHIAIAPIPCAFLILEDHHASRIFWKFTMSFAANCLQGFFIVLSIGLYNVLVSKIMHDAIQSGAELATIVGGLLLGSIVLVVTVVKSGSIAKSILDA